MFCRLRCFLFYIMRYTELCYRMRCSPVLQNAATTSGKHPDGCASRAVCSLPFIVRHVFVRCVFREGRTTEHVKHRVDRFFSTHGRRWDQN